MQISHTDGLAWYKVVGTDSFERFDSHFAYTRWEWNYPRLSLLVAVGVPSFLLAMAPGADSALGLSLIVLNFFLVVAAMLIPLTAGDYVTLSGLISYREDDGLLFPVSRRNIALKCALALAAIGWGGAAVWVVLNASVHRTTVLTLIVMGVHGGTALVSTFLGVRILLRLRGGGLRLTPTRIMATRGFLRVDEPWESVRGVSIGPRTFTLEFQDRSVAFKREDYASDANVIVETVMYFLQNPSRRFLLDSGRAAIKASTAAP